VTRVRSLSDHHIERRVVSVTALRSFSDRRRSNSLFYLRFSDPNRECPNSNRSNSKRVKETRLDFPVFRKALNHMQMGIQPTRVPKQSAW